MDNTLEEVIVPTYLTMDELEYDMKLHRYTITDDGFTDRFGIVLHSIIDIAMITDKDTAVRTFKRKVSDDVYSFIYRYVTSRNRDAVEYELAHNEKMIESLREALYNYAEYLIYNDSAFSRAIIDMDKNRTTDRDLVEKGALPLNVFNELRSSNILYKGGINLPIDFKDGRGELY